MEILKIHIKANQVETKKLSAQERGHVWGVAKDLHLPLFCALCSEELAFSLFLK